MDRTLQNQCFFFLLCRLLSPETSIYQGQETPKTKRQKHTL